MARSGSANGVKKEEPLDEDELDEELWGSGDEDEPSGAGPYEIGKKLRAPVTARYSCASLCTMIREFDIDLEADYQRGVVWNEKKQSRIIDSILQHFYVPPVLFSMKDHDSSGVEREVRVCVDGKQRLSAIAAFMQAAIPVRESKTGRSFYYKSIPDVPDPPDKIRNRRYVFTEQQRKAFGMLQISAVEYMGLSDADERDMFQRVQMGMALSAAEKLAASTGPWPEFCHELEKRYVEGDDEVPNKITFRNLLPLDRGKDFLFMAQIVLLIFHEHETNYIPFTSKVQKFFDECKAAGDREPTDTERSIVLKTMTRWVEIANDPDVNEPILPKEMPHRRKKTLAPVEFVFAAFMVRYFSRASNRELVNLISGFMGIVREKHPANVFFNTKVEKTIRMYMHHQERLHPNWVAEDLGILSGSQGEYARRRRGREDDDNEFVPNSRELYSNQRRRLD